MTDILFNHIVARIMRPLILLIFIMGMGIGCNSETHKQEKNKQIDYDTTAVVQEGKKIASATFRTLSGNLQQALAEGGVDYALQFCNVEAMPLTDSLSSYHNVTIRRASHKPRNPSNKADSLEMRAIEQYLTQLEKGENLEPITYSDDKTISFHAPITITNKLCLNCHGKPNKDITKSDLAKIQELYPMDRATGFSMGELRGVWSIRFPASHFDSTQIKKIAQ